MSDNALRILQGAMSVSSDLDVEKYNTEDEDLRDGQVAGVDAAAEARYVGEFLRNSVHSHDHQARETYRSPSRSGFYVHLFIVLPGSFEHCKSQNQSGGAHTMTSSG